MKKNTERGQILIVALVALTVMAILVPAIVYWIQLESKWTVKEQKQTVAFHLAQAAIERGMWKLKSSTSTWNEAYAGTVISGFNFDVTYSDMQGGYYRIKFSPLAGNNQIAIIGEGKDLNSKEVRAIRVTYQNQCIPGAVISKGMITWANAFEAHWGPIMAHKNINITDAAAAQQYFPRKYSRQVVQGPGSGTYARDTNGIDPPNTDGVEWWSAYPVPDLPILDFQTLSDSASATNTLNVYGCADTGAAWDQNVKTKTSWSSKLKKWVTTTSPACPGGSPHTYHFGNSYNHPDSQKGYTWYWDGDVILTGGSYDKANGIKGNLIVRGNLTIDAEDYISGPVDIPPDAFLEYKKMDGNDPNEYPGDDGKAKCRSKFTLGSETWTGGPFSSYTDVGISGFVYVGKDLTINAPCDFHGAIWVEGNVNKNVGSERSTIYFDDKLNIPSLNVVLVNKSWEEIQPSAAAWANP